MTTKKEIWLSAGTYWAQVDLERAGEGLNPHEQTRLKQFGLPIVECGGEFELGDESPEEIFELPSDSRIFPEQFPVKQCFPISAYGENAAIMAASWAEQVTDRVVSGVAEKVSMIPGNTGSFVTTYNVGGN
jgi:hypothetical protein